MLFCCLCHEKMSCPEGGKNMHSSSNFMCFSEPQYFMKELRARKPESCGNFRHRILETCSHSFRKGHQMQEGYEFIMH